MFGSFFVSSVLVSYVILVVTIKLGIFDSVVYKFGTQRSLTTKVWALFLTIISVLSIGGIGLLVEFLVEGLT
jgi:hypothetical protein